MLRAAKIAAGSIVVLSDGADTGSRSSATEAAAAAGRPRMHGSSRWAPLEVFPSAPLEQLALAAGGDLLGGASTAALTHIYDQLGARLAGEYLVRYRSIAGPNEKIRVEVRVDGIPGRRHRRLRHPSATRVQPSLSSGRSWRFWLSALTMFLVSLGAAALFALGVMMMVRAAPGEPEGPDGAVRLSARGEPREDETRLTERVFAGAERSLETTQVVGTLRRDARARPDRFPAVQLLLCTFVATFLAMWLLAMLGGSLSSGCWGSACRLRCGR